MKLEKGKKAATPKGMSHNVKTMEKAGYSKKRAEGTAYGEVGMEKKARKDESKGILNQLKNKEVKQAYKETEEYKRKKEYRKINMLYQ